jgi:hypothetical protein
MAKNLLGLLFLFCFSTGIILAQTKPGESVPAENPFSSGQTLSNRPNVELYPNPSTEFLNIKIDNNEFQNVKFELFNIIGNAMPMEVEETGKNRYRIPVKNLSSGYYLLIISDKDKKYTAAYKFQKR